MMRIGTHLYSAREIQALGDTAEGRVVFHNGLWGAEMCYMWAGPEPGRGAGRVPGWESEALERLRRHHLVTIQPRPGAMDVPVVPTRTGLASLTATSLPRAA